MRVRYQGRNVEVREQGSGPPIVLVHGYPLDGDMWAPVSQILSGKFRVMRPDLPSRRDTPAPPAPTIAEYASWISAVVDALGADAGLAGFSMGGYVALELLKRKSPSIRAAALVSTRAEADDEAGRAARNAAIFTAREMGPGAVSERMVPKLLSRRAMKNADLVARVTAMTRRQNPNSLENDLLAMRDRPDSTAALSEISIPSLAVAGSEDSIVPAAIVEGMAKHIRGCHFTVIEGAAHLTPMEKPEEVATALGDLFSANLS